MCAELYQSNGESKGAKARPPQLRGDLSSRHDLACRPVPAHYSASLEQIGTILSASLRLQRDNAVRLPESPRVVMTQTVLIVDDDPVQRRLLETAIARMG